MEIILFIGKVLGILFLLFMAFLTWCIFAISSKDSRREEEEELKRQHKTCLLSDLEKQTVETLLQAFEEDGVNFIINDGKIVDYEVVE